MTALPDQMSRVAEPILEGDANVVGQLSDHGWSLGGLNPIAMHGRRVRPLLRSISTAFADIQPAAGLHIGMPGAIAGD